MSKKYAKVKGTQVIQYPWNIDNLREENPYTQFDVMSVLDNLQEVYATTDSAKDGSTIVEVVEFPEPLLTDSRYKKYEIGTSPVLKDGVWGLETKIVDKTDEEYKFGEETKRNIEIDRRDHELKYTDWTQATDVPPELLSGVDKQKYAEYRQKLRDLPLQTGFPWTHTWPARPA